MAHWPIHHMTLTVWTPTVDLSSLRYSILNKDQMTWFDLLCKWCFECSHVTSRGWNASPEVSPECYLVLNGYNWETGLILLIQSYYNNSHYYARDDDLLRCTAMMVYGYRPICRKYILLCKNPLTLFARCTVDPWRWSVDYLITCMLLISIPQLDNRQLRCWNNTFYWMLEWQNCIGHCVT